MGPRQPDSSQPTPPPGDDTARSQATTRGDDATVATADVEARVRAAIEASRQARVRRDPFVGRRIAGRFQIVSRIGEGGMGAVYRAIQTSVQRPVAIKVLLRNLVADDKLVRRFHNEALAVSKLRHPNTVRIIDFGQVDDATLYIAMELLDGESLGTVLRREGPMPVRRVLRILEQVALALDEAHTAGIVHRDLKPDNLFLCPVQGNPDFVKVLDFGVAKLTGEGQAESLTRAQAILGTPKYMAPEQARGGKVDARSDLYALGVIAYEAITGRAPFEGDPMQVLYKQVHEPPPPMHERAPGIVVPDAVARVVMRLLDKDPARRAPSASALAEELRRLHDALPPACERVLRRADPEARAVDEATDTALFPPTHVEVAPRPWRRRIAVVAGAISVLGALAWGGWQLWGPQPPPASAPTLRARTPHALPPLDFPRRAVAIEVRSQPPGATVRDGDTVLGKTPLRIEAWQGSADRRLELRLDDGRHTELVVSFDADGEYVAELPEPPAQPQPASTDRPASARRPRPTVGRSPGRRGHPRADPATHPTEPTATDSGKVSPLK